MIRINLLPLRASKKKESAVQQIVLFCAVIVIAAAVVMSLYVVRRVQVANTKKDITAANAKINELKAKIGKLQELQTLKEQVKKKLDVLAKLRKDKTGPAHRLATLSDSTPDQLWLTGYSESAGNIRISGVAYVEELIAQYMRALEASADYMNVELIVSEQTEVAGIKLKKFDVTMKLKETPPPAAKK
ncbi:MAG: PilN domain-containing protein [Desulfuromonadaceae bacterium]|nr:PilN domain-containing protein [Desulfuromonadaceae bacterium]